MDVFNLSIQETQAIWLSMKVAMLCAVLSLPLAIAVGWLLARREFRGKLIFDGVIQLPLVLPPVTTGYLLLVVLGANGIVGHLFAQWFGLRISFTFFAAVLAAMVVSFPLIVRAVRIAIEMVDRDYEQAARTLGAGPIMTFFKVTFPMALPGIFSGFVLCFARSLGEFGATITFAGNIVGKTQTLPLAIYSVMEIPGREMAAFRLALASIILSFLAMGLSEYLNRKLKKGH